MQSVSRSVCPAFEIIQPTVWKHWKKLDVLIQPGKTIHWSYTLLIRHPTHQILATQALHLSQRKKNKRKIFRSTCVHESLFDFNEIWHVGRGRWVMHDGMQYDSIQSQGQGHEPFKVRNPAILHFQKLSPPPFTMGAGNWPWILKVGHNI